MEACVDGRMCGWMGPPSYWVSETTTSALCLPALSINLSLMDPHTLHPGHWLSGGVLKKSERKLRK